jgi:hypothetical protein
VNPLLLAALLAAPPGQELAFKALDEFARVCEAGGKSLWGKPLCGPLVLVHPATRAAVANMPDPEGAFRKTGEYYSGLFPERFTPANTAIQWGGRQWATVLLPLPHDPFRRLALLAHESFHRIQGELSLGASDAPGEHLDTEAGRLWLRLELRALARALRLAGPAARESAADALLFRLHRHRLCPGAEPLEAALEKHEGLAEYTGVLVALRATGEDIGRVARAVESFEDGDAYARSFAYATGPALGLLLDRYDSKWRARAASVPLHSLLIAALQVKPRHGLESAAAGRAGRYGYPAVAAAEREREARRQLLLADLKARFLDGPVVEFPSAPEMTRAFNPTTLAPFPPHGVYYPTGTFTANWGKLQVESGGALVAPDNRSLLIPAPADPAASPLRGPGWTLHLAPGWRIRPAARQGCFTVVPPDPR